MTSHMFDPTPERERQSRLLRLASFYERLDRASLRLLPEFYAGDARFRDPFNDVTGLAAIQRVFEHMFDKLEQPRFIVTGRYLGELDVHEEAMLCWEMRFRARVFGATEQSITGCSHLLFGGDGLVRQHRDHWDAAGEFYEKLPVLGLLARKLRTRLTAQPT
jgi:steroid delta-isomerase